MIRWKLLLLLPILGGALDPSESPTSAVIGSSGGLFSIVRDLARPWSELSVELPSRHPLYHHFTANVVDVTEAIDSSVRDENRTFMAAPGDETRIHIRNLNPGHKYSVSIIGRKGEKAELIKEEHVTTEPRAVEFPSDAVREGSHNISLVTDKEPKAVQDSFLIEYRQLDPEKKFPLLEVLDIPEQKQLEVYLGNLSPGRDYSVKMTSARDGVRSRPWTATLTTKPLPVTSLRVSENASCVVLSWSLPEGGADAYVINYALKDAQQNTTVTIPYPSTSALLCETIWPGRQFVFSIAPKKTLILGEAVSIEHTVKPLPPSDFKCRPDITKGKYRVSGELLATSHYEKCQVTVVSETLEKVEVEADVEQKNGKTWCNLLLSLAPGERFEFTFSASSNGVSSSKLHRSVVLTPAFDMKGFGLSIQEGRGGLEMSWPQSDVFMSRLKDIWNKVVGPDSLLQLRVSPLNRKEKSLLYESSPFKPSTLEVKSLTKGACYKVQLYTVTKSGIVSESRFDETLRTSAPPVNASLHDVTRTSATLNLTLASKDEPMVVDCQLNVVVLDMHSQVVFDKRLPLSTNVPLIELNGLRPFHKYTVNTQIVCGTGSTECAPSTRTMRQLSFSTEQDRPGPVQSLAGHALNPYSVKLGWLPPALPNGVLKHYIAQITPQDASQPPWSVQVGLSSDRVDHAIETVVDGLVGGERYNFSVRAATEAGPGEEPTNGGVALAMPIMAPPRPQSAPQAVVESIGSQSLSLKYSSAVFDSKHGRIIRSALIVAEVTEDGRVSETWMQGDNETYTWLQVQHFDVWPAYTASMSEVPAQGRIGQPRPLSEAVGVDQTCEDLPVETVCNGPLKPGSHYKFKLRLFTAPNLYTDSPYSTVVATERASRGLSLKASVLLLSVLVILGLVGVIGIALWNRSKKARNASYSSKESQWAALKMIMAERAADCLAKLGLDGSQNVPPEGEDRANPHLQPTFGHHRRCRSLRERTGVDHRLERLPSGPIHKHPLYTVMTGVGVNIYKSRPVRKCDFEPHVRNMSADSEFRFSEEYESLKNIGVGQSIHAADLAVNRLKNRFTNILPYDHSRVKLMLTDEDEGSDYINANYMPGFSSRREFIAAQGPLPCTRDAFWQMAWEQQCPAIIALTKCVEKGRDKCHQYWPDNEHMSVVYADIEVTLMCETHYDEFTIRELRLTKLHDPSPPRTIRHLHYMAWPDFGVPDHPEGILRFARLYRAKVPHSPHNKPTIVHCSAGVGRSGTFMTIDRLLPTIQQDRPIDVFGIVHEMRLERCHMVQNEQQYIFIHHCILHALQTGVERSSAPSAAEIHQNPAFEDDDEGIAESGF